MDSSGEGEDMCERPLVSEITRRQLQLKPPEEKLQYFDSSAQKNADNQEYDACIEDLVRCLALSRLVHGDGHFKVAQAHGRLAKAYLQFKGWGPQTLEHTSAARRVLGLCTGVDRTKLEQELLSLCIAEGEAELLTERVSEAESSFLKAEKVLERTLDHTEQSSDLLQLQKNGTELEICSGLYRVYRRQGRAAQALLRCERCLELLTDTDQPLKLCAVYRDMAHIHQDQGNEDRAMELLLKAHTTALTQTPAALREGAAVSHRLALLLSTSAQSQRNDNAEQYFEQSLSLYQSSVGQKDPDFLTAQDDFCRFLLLRGQHQRCLELQKSSLSWKRAAFGDASAEVADALQLVGSVEMTVGQLPDAYRSMSECLELQSVLFGPQHKKTKAAQKAVDMLLRSPVVTDGLQRSTRPRLQTHSPALSSEPDRSSASEPQVNMDST